MDRRAPLFLAAVLAALPVLAEDEGGLPPIEGIEEGAEVPCGPGSQAPTSSPAEPRQPGPGGERRPEAGRPRPAPAPENPCLPSSAPDGRAPAATPPPLPADPAAEERRGTERRARQQSAGRSARRQAQALVGSLQGADSGAASAAPAPAAASPAGNDPGGVVSAADFRRLNEIPAAAGPNTLRTNALPAPGGAPAKAPPAAPPKPLWRRAWDATADFVDRHTPSPMKLADDVYYEASKRFPDTSSHNTEQDAWRHARWHQRMVDSLCPETGRSVCAPVAAGVAMAAGTVHELMGAVSGQPAAEFKMDMSNNWKGTLAGVKGGDPRLIDEALRTGTLVVLAPAAAPGTPMVAKR